MGITLDRILQHKASLDDALAHEVQDDGVLSPPSEVAERVMGILHLWIRTARDEGMASYTMQTMLLDHLDKYGKEPAEGMCND